MRAGQLTRTSTRPGVPPTVHPLAPLPPCYAPSAHLALPTSLPFHHPPIHSLPPTANKPNTRLPKLLIPSSHSPSAIPFVPAQPYSSSLPHQRSLSPPSPILLQAVSTHLTPPPPTVAKFHYFSFFYHQYIHPPATFSTHPHPFPYHFRSPVFTTSQISQIALDTSSSHFPPPSVRTLFPLP